MKNFSDTLLKTSMNLLETAHNLNHHLLPTQAKLSQKNQGKSPELTTKR